MSGVCLFSLFVFPFSPTRYCGRPIKSEAFAHVSGEAEQSRGFLLPTDESRHGGRVVDGLQLRLQVKYLHLALL